MSARAEIQWQLVDFISRTGRFTAPYGVIASEPTADERGRKYRGITFGVARVSDVHVRIYSPTFIVINDSRFGKTVARSPAEVGRVLADNYRLGE